MKFLSIFTKRQNKINETKFNLAALEYAVLLKDRIQSDFYLVEYTQYESNLDAYFSKYPLTVSKITTSTLSTLDKAKLVGILNHTQAEMRFMQIILKEIENWLQYVKNSQ